MGEGLATADMEGSVNCRGGGVCELQWGKGLVAAVREGCGNCRG